MDLGKAKNVIIALLITFNIFLLVNNFTYFTGQGVPKETLENAIAILKNRGVSLDQGMSIPTRTKATYRLIYGDTKLDKDEIAEKLLGDSFVMIENGKEFTLDGKRLVFSSDTEFVLTEDKSALTVDMDNMNETKKAAREYLKDKGLLSGKYVEDDWTRN